MGGMCRFGEWSVTMSLCEKDKLPPRLRLLGAAIVVVIGFFSGYSKAVTKAFVLFIGADPGSTADGSRT